MGLLPETPSSRPVVSTAGPPLFSKSFMNYCNSDGAYTELELCLWWPENDEFFIVWFTGPFMVEDYYCCVGYYCIKDFEVVNELVAASKLTFTLSYVIVKLDKFISTMLLQKEHSLGSLFNLSLYFFFKAYNFYFICLRAKFSFSLSSYSFVF